jgi:DivIVA domain-containing protein
VANFPTAKRGQRGYNTKQVDAFLQAAREAYDGRDDSSMHAADIRRTGFGLQRGGYETSAVDAALERIEDALASRERESARREHGDRQWLDEARTTAQVILNRLGRPDGERFDRTNAARVGYHRRDVDRFAKRLTRYFRDGLPLSVDDVRRVVFRQQRRGYREAQVDMLLDAVVEVMLAVR